MRFTTLSSVLMAFALSTSMLQAAESKAPSKDVKDAKAQTVQSSHVSKARVASKKKVKAPANAVETK